MDASSRGGVASQVEASIWESFRQYLEGMELYRRGEPVEACENSDQRRGWWDALNADAEMDAPIGYYESRYPFLY
ncbi:hypothetical protein [Caldilinea sp.]|uniref:hypothetical protein n=1 Tax=Caldilinea sp. TaxID=2293560 RepID=UPI0021DE247E|nr:hypothetical protein [Caldilinea sp.]GIV73507.1 MAG: hypothetical protein KatS3mg049_2063 [Caldilinea sp.]